jgi:hypothetical protein
MRETLVERLELRLELLVAEPPDRHPAERRKNVQLDVAAVAGVGAGPQPRLLGRQPLRLQVGTERHGTRHVESAVRLRRKPRGEPLGI